MKFMPRSTTRFSTARARAGSSGSPHTSLPGKRIAPKPRRHTSRSPSRIVGGETAKLASSFMVAKIALATDPDERARAVGQARARLALGSHGLLAEVTDGGERGRELRVDAMPLHEQRGGVVREPGLALVVFPGEGLQRQVDRDRGPRDHQRRTP